MRRAASFFVKVPTNAEEGRAEIFLGCVKGIGSLLEPHRQKREKAETDMFTQRFGCH
jgi:hypothetical protein